MLLVDLNCSIKTDSAVLMLPLVNKFHKLFGMEVLQQLFAGGDFVTIIVWALARTHRLSQYPGR